MLIQAGSADWFSIETVYVLGRGTLTGFCLSSRGGQQMVVIMLTVNLFYFGTQCSQLCFGVVILI